MDQPRLHIVNPYNSTAMRRMVEPITGSIKFQDNYYLTESDAPTPDADLNYFVPWRGMLEHPEIDMGASKVVVHYTHCNPGDEEAIQAVCHRADAVIAMTFTGRKELLALGVDPAKIQVIYSSGETFSMRRRNIGIDAYVQPNSRKREHALIDLAWQLDPITKQCLNFIIAGTGWEDTIEKARRLGLTIQHFEHLDDDNLQQFFGQLDALLLLGHAEGGPLPMLEAMCCGVPVIAPEGRGYAGDFPYQVMSYSNETELLQSLKRVVMPSLREHMFGRMLTWKQYELEHALLFSRVLSNVSPDIYLEYGLSRYGQLLDIIEQIKPMRICEVGTWTGWNALRMLQAAGKFHPLDKIHYWGYDLWEQATTEQLLREHSKFPPEKRIVETLLKASGATITLEIGDTAATLANEMAPRADFYFIDGGHSTDTILSDWSNIQAVMPHRAVVVFDDYYVSGAKPGIGCNELIDALALDPAWCVLPLPVVTKTPDGSIRMVQVSHA